MVKIRLRRMGSHKKPFYRIVVADSRAPRNGRFIEEIGYYNPVSEPKKVEVNEEKALKWMLTGAQASETVKSLFKKNGLLDKFETAKAERKQK
ncbi:30S ribosomal protein S16 [Filifactor villosus]|uniref:Small ribosomal subunit protein bS16 n=1 Tax=Filifactor villosus TaxID=29374 RepID=A0ABV9QNM1_9FIRM|nr:30S ribosomal protein S16 [Filifactor alocis]